MKISKLYKYPIKSLTPFETESLSLNSHGYIDGDRLFGFRFNNAGKRTDLAWQRKTNFAALMHMPQIARLKVNYNESERKIKIVSEGKVVVDENVDSAREIIEEKFTDYVLGTDSELIKKFPERFPFILVGGDDGNNFHDTASGGVTLHSQESLDDLKKRTGFNLVHTRFRTNIVIEDSDPWNELNWIGKQININQNNFVVEKAVPRCLAINCNPDTGERDYNLLKSMLQIQDVRPPEFAIKLIPQESKGIINIGDDVQVI